MRLAREHDMPDPTVVGRGMVEERDRGRSASPRLQSSWSMIAAWHRDALKIDLGALDL